MKKLFVFIVGILLTLGVFAQAPQRMSYQCVVRNASGALVTNQSVGIRISILQGSSSGTVIYQETYNPDPQTNANGLVSIEIGGGVPVTGTFSGIDWASGSYFLKTETDPSGGTSYTIVGISQLLSVPYALYSLIAGSSGDAVKITGDQTIAGHKTFNGITTVGTPINGTDAANKDYVDALVKRISELENQPGVVKDYDGNLYTTVKIGNQVWMAENLKTTTYGNGDLIGTTTPATKDISLEGAPKYQWPSGGEESNVATYGRLYTWYAVTDSRNVCPNGWHVSTDAEWTNLATNLGGENIAGGKLKEAGTTHWNSPNANATNESGFTGLPGCYRYRSGAFNPRGCSGYWWSPSSTDINTTWYQTLGCNVSYVWRRNSASDGSVNLYGFSVRCVKN